MADLDRVIHEPSRLVIVAILSAVDEADFVFLLRQSGLSRGNLSAHMTRLEEAGYVRVNKRFRGRVPQTVYSLTEAGRAAFRDYCERVKRMVESLDRD
ncbi:MAG: transcriptional regulator [Anaerolineae bacterium]|nr:transcriptional regulator [Anaerolineae bacterium]